MVTNNLTVPSIALIALSASSGLQNLTKVNPLGFLVSLSGGLKTKQPFLLLKKYKIRAPSSSFPNLSNSARNSSSLVPSGYPLTISLPGCGEGGGLSLLDAPPPPPPYCCLPLFTIVAKRIIFIVTQQTSLLTFFPRNFRSAPYYTSVNTWRVFLFERIYFQLYGTHITHAYYEVKTVALQFEPRSLSHTVPCVLSWYHPAVTLSSTSTCHVCCTGSTTPCPVVPLTYTVNILPVIKYDTH